MTFNEEFATAGRAHQLDRAWEYVCNSPISFGESDGELYHRACEVIDRARQQGWRNGVIGNFVRRFLDGDTLCRQLAFLLFDVKISWEESCYSRARLKAL